MRKIIDLTLIAVSVVILSTGCAQKNIAPATTAEEIVLKDGIYTSSGSQDENGWTPEMVLTISNGKINEIKYDEIAAMRKSQSIEYQRSFKAQQKIDLLSVYSALQKSLILTQDAAKLDVVAGATKSSESFKALSAEALKNAKVDNKYKDGTYTAKGQIDEKNWTPTIKITIKNNKITSAVYDEVSSKVFKCKSQDAAYVAAFKEKSKIDLLIVYDALQKTLIEKQDLSSIDTVTGATSTSTNFVKLAKDAVGQAK